MTCLVEIVCQILCVFNKLNVYNNVYWKTNKRVP